MVYDIVVKAYFGAFFKCLLLITSILSIVKLKRVTDDKIIKILYISFLSFNIYNIKKGVLIEKSARKL